MGKQVVVIAGPTGSGESTITKEIVRRYPKRVTRLVTATTRAPRRGEKHGVDYYFFSKDDFLEKQAAGDIVEATLMRGDTYYGTYAPDLSKKLDEGYIVIVNPDIIGAQFYKKQYGAVTIFIMPESINVLLTRIKKRTPGMTEKEFERRRMSAEQEINEERQFYDHEVVNKTGELEKAVRDVLSILRKEGYRIE